MTFTHIVPESTVAYSLLCLDVSYRIIPSSSETKRVGRKWLFTVCFQEAVISTYGWLAFFKCDISCHILKKSPKHIPRQEKCRHAMEYQTILFGKCLLVWRIKGWQMHVRSRSNNLPDTCDMENVYSMYGSPWIFRPPLLMLNLSWKCGLETTCWYRFCTMYIGGTFCIYTKNKEVQVNLVGII